MQRYADHVRIDEKKVPEQFRHLIPHAKYWSVGDDVERCRLMARTSLAQKRALVDAVWPLWKELNAWCDEAHGFATPVPDEVVIFEMLFEPVAEARVEVYPAASDPPEAPTPTPTAQVQASNESVSSSLRNSFPDVPEHIAKELVEINAMLNKLLAKCKKLTATVEPGGNEPAAEDTEPGASPNGGPATRIGNSGVKEGPPSVG
jgi:hypothetical protein